MATQPIWIEILGIRFNVYLGLVKTDNGFKIHIFNIIDVKNMKCKRQKYP